MHTQGNDPEELLLALLNGPFKRIRDENHVDPYSILVYDEGQQPMIQAVEFLDLLGRYPCQEINTQWNPRDFVRILEEKRNQYRKSMASHDISEEDSTTTPVCGTVVLLVNKNPKLPHRWVSINALIEAD